MPTIFLTLILDDRSEKDVRQLWNRLGEVGLLNPKKPRHRPHVTISGYETNDVEKYVDGLKHFVSLARPVPIMMHDVGVFPEPRVVFAGVTMHESLWNLHQSLPAHFEPLGAPPCSPNFLPNQWTPHCTLVEELPDDESVGKAIAALMPVWHAIDGKGVGIGLLVKDDAPVDKIEDRVQFSFGHRR